MEAPEVPIEAVQEHLHEHAQHAAHEPEKRWVLGVALTSAIFAALAAVASLLAGHHVNEALISQLDANDKTVQASNQWAYYQAKGVKASVLASKMELLAGLGKTPDPADDGRVQRYETEQQEIKDQAEGLEHEAKHLKEEGEVHLGTHVTLARAVTMFQVSIAVAAISVLVNRRLFWLVSLAFGMVGVYYLIRALWGH